MRKVYKYRYLIIAFLLGIIAIMFGGGVVASADNNSGNYTTAAEDLQKDESFDIWAYPAIPDDYSLQVIQIAESTAGELFIYVYQPSGAVTNFKATCVNMSLSDEVKEPDLYNLKLLNSSGVFYKYLAEGVKVSSASERLYNITSIYRAWSEDYDKGTGNDNTISEVSFAVGKIFVASGSGDSLVYNTVETEVIRITDKYVGTIRYKSGYRLQQTACDSHFVAFSTDREIDRLKSATVKYEKKHYNELDGHINFVEAVPETKKVEGEVVSGSVNAGIFKKKYSYQRIENTDEFLRNEETLTTTQRANVAKKQWVLRFCDTYYGEDHYGAFGTKVNKTWWEVEYVTVLELEFETAGTLYKLGCVDNKQRGHNIGDGGLEWWQILLIVIAVVLVLSLVLKILSLFMSVFGVIFKGLWFVITSPFRLIVWIIKKARGDD